MKRSTERILTTHTGSLPRPKPLAELLMRKDRGEEYDAAALAEAVRAAVKDVVRRQVAIGVDIVDDGEMSKPGYSTYIADRLTGFMGPTARQVIVRLTAFLLMCIGVQILVTALGDLVAKWRALRGR